MSCGEDSREVRTLTNGSNREIYLGEVFIMDRRAPKSNEEIVIIKTVESHVSHSTGQDGVEEENRIIYHESL